MARDEEYKVSAPTKTKIDEFNTADAAYKKELAQFEEDHASELAILEKLRADRNDKMDLAAQALRAEAEGADYNKVKRMSYGPFVAQKRMSKFYDVNVFKALAQKYNLWKQLIDLGVLKEEVILAKKFDETKAILSEKGWVDNFAEAEDTAPAGAPAITKPGIVPMFGAETKEKK